MTDLAPRARPFLETLEDAYVMVERKVLADAHRVDQTRRAQMAATDPTNRKTKATKANAARKSLRQSMEARDRLAVTLAKHRRWAAQRADANPSHPDDTGDTE